jgi:hypothetical protein
MPKMKKPVLLYFQEIVPGDVRKFRAESNDSPTGGGARDLRIPKKYGPRLSAMFPKAGGQAGLRVGEIYCQTDAGTTEHAEVTLWRPTDARPGELRLGKIYNVSACNFDEGEYGEARESGEMWFFLLVKDADGVVWAKILKQRHLTGERDEVRRYIAQRINAKRGNIAVRGTMDFVTGENFLA